MMDSVNYVAKLNEFAQKNRLQLKYEDVGSAGPDHIKTFTLRAVLDGKTYPDGVGKNKKEAKQNAAKNALRLLEDPPESSDNLTEASVAPVHQTKISNYIGWLNEYSQKHRVDIKLVETLTLGPGDATNLCKFVIGDKEYPGAYGRTKKDAKEKAAKLAYHELCGNKTTETGDENCSGISSQQKENVNQKMLNICDQTKGLSLKTEISTATDTNYIGIINHYCQKTSRSYTFIEDRRCGEPHSRQYFYKLEINKKEYPVGEGKTIKEAKQSAAQLAWSALQEQSDWDSKVTFRSAVSDDGSQSKPSIPPSTQDSGCVKSNMPVTTTDSIVFTNSSNPPMDQDQTPDVKPKIKIAANFQNVMRSSKEDIMPNFKFSNSGNSQSGKTPTQSGTSRFTSEFDSIERLGKGAFGRVFKAKQTLLDICYAIKIVRCKEKSLREVGALSALYHPNIVRYYTCWLEDSEYQWESSADSCSTSRSSSDSSVKYLYIQMELCDTRTLRVWIDEKNTQNVKKSLRDSKRRDESLTIIQQIVAGVEYIHSEKLIHRDLKPTNIMFGRDGAVKIGDFGLVTAENDDNENLLERTEYKGTPSYMAPEQRIRITYDRKVDIFALGLIYFELLWNLSTGHEKVAIWDNVRNQNLPEGFSHHFHQESQIIKSMLRLKPEDRLEASEIKMDLEECKRALTVVTNMRRDSHTV